jgi:hypothetical protein
MIIFSLHVMFATSACQNFVCILNEEKSEVSLTSYLIYSVDDKLKNMMPCYQKCTFMAAI